MEVIKRFIVSVLLQPRLINKKLSKQAYSIQNFQKALISYRNPIHNILVF